MYRCVCVPVHVCGDPKLKLKVFLNHCPPYSLRQSFSCTQRAPIQLVSLAISLLGSPVFSFKMLELVWPLWPHGIKSYNYCTHNYKCAFYCNYLVACSRSFSVCVVIIAAPLSIKTLGLRKGFLTSEAHN